MVASDMSDNNQEITKESNDKDVPISAEKLFAQAMMEAQAASAQSEAIEEEEKVFHFADIIFYAFLILIVLAAVAFSADQGERKSLLGYRIYNVLSSSMQIEIPKGSMVLVEEVKPADIQVGEDITFFSDTTGVIVTHRVIEAIPAEEGTVPSFRTQGVSNPEPDDWIVDGRNVVGRVVWHVPLVGFILDYVATHLPIVAVILILLFMLINMVGYLFRSREKGAGEMHVK